MARGQAGSRKYMERVASKIFSESLLFKQVDELEMLQKATDESHDKKKTLSFSESEGERRENYYNLHNRDYKNELLWLIATSGH